MRVNLVLRRAASVGMACALLAPLAAGARRPPLPDLPFDRFYQSRRIDSGIVRNASGASINDRYGPLRYRFFLSYEVEIEDARRSELACDRSCVRSRAIDHSQCTTDWDQLNCMGNERHNDDERHTQRGTLNRHADERDRYRAPQAAQSDGVRTFPDMLLRDLPNMPERFEQFDNWAEGLLEAQLGHADFCGRRQKELQYRRYTFRMRWSYARLDPTTGEVLTGRGAEGTRGAGIVGEALLPETVENSESLFPGADRCTCRPSATPPLGTPGGSGGGRRDKGSPLKPEEFEELPPGLSLVNDTGFAAVNVGSASTTSSVQRVVAERFEVGATTGVAGLQSRGDRRATATLWPWGTQAGRWLWSGLSIRPAEVSSTHPRVMRMSTASTQAPGDVEASLVATGRASGEVFRLEVSNPSAEALHLVAPDGLVLEPIKPGAGSPVSATARDLVQRYPIVGYCLDFAKPPPVAGMVFRIAPRAVQEQFRPLRAVLRAGRQLADAGRLHPDSNPQTYAEFVRQWAVWTQVEQWDAQEFTEKFVARTKENAERSKQRWTPSMAQQLRAAAPNRWRDIRHVLDEAKALEGARP